MSVIVKSWVLALIEVIFTALLQTAAAETATQPYTKWFFDTESGDVNVITFRKFGFEGLARNLFVLSCRRGESALVEIIPPKSLEEQLKRVGPVDAKSSTISFSEFGGKDLLSFIGEYDKIAAFVEPKDNEDLFRFLNVINSNMVRLSILSANISYIMITNDNLARAKEQVPALFYGGRFREMAWQDVYVLCADFRAKK